MVKWIDPPIYVGEEVAEWIRALLQRQQDELDRKIRELQRLMICPYALEEMFRDPQNNIAGHRRFCAWCPDAEEIPYECDDWNCTRCDAACPCHTLPDERRIKAHDEYWRKHGGIRYIEKPSEEVDE